MAGSCMAKKEHLLSVGCPPALAAAAFSLGFSWLQLLMVAAQYGPQVWDTIQNDLTAGKTLIQILQDLISGLPPVPAPTP